MEQFNILLTDNAVKHLKKTIKEGEALHISLKVSGCNGYAYVLDVKPTVEENQISVKGVKLVVEPKFRKQLDFSTIDYKREGINARLVIENPQVKYQCGCGESVSF